jgi:hypothetical protein
MSEADAYLREITRSFGRVYQKRLDQCGVAIEWVPSVPILGCMVLIHGQALFDPTEGRVVRFPKAIRRRRGTTTLAVRTTQRPDLLELFELATKMEAELISEVEAARRSRHPSGVTSDRSAADQR